MKKWVRLSLMSLPIIASFGSVGIYFFIKSRGNLQTDKKIIGVDDEIDKKIPKYKKKYDNIFPKINNRYLYRYIKIVDSDITGIHPYITDQMIAELVKEVITGLGTSEGSVQVSYVKINLGKVIVNFVWTYESQKVAKQYTLYINAI